MEVGEINMKNIIKKYKWLLTICLLILCSSCSSNKKYLEGNTHVRAEYFGDVEANVCSPNFKCENSNNTECAMALYDEAVRATKVGVRALKKDRDFGRAAFQFSFALCNVYNIKNVLDLMKIENYDEWETLRQSGFMDHIKDTSVNLNLMIEKCELLENNIK